MGSSSCKNIICKAKAPTIEAMIQHCLDTRTKEQTTPKQSENQTEIEDTTHLLDQRQPQKEAKSNITAPHLKVLVEDDL